MLEKNFKNKLGKGTLFVTADEHYGHTNILKFCNRPFGSVREMNEELIRRHNKVVSEEDFVIHAGDFAMTGKQYTENIIRRLNGTHFFLKGSHDKWLPKDHDTRWEAWMGKQYVVIDHYCLRTWGKSHYNSWHLHGHSHGGLDPVGKQLDVGVDTNNFYPYSWADIESIMTGRPDNFNLVKKGKR